MPAKADEVREPEQSSVRERFSNWLRVNWPYHFDAWKVAPAPWNFEAAIYRAQAVAMEKSWQAADAAAYERGIQMAAMTAVGLKPDGKSFVDAYPFHVACVAVRKATLALIEPKEKNHAE